MYYFFALLLAFVFLILTVGGETGRGREHPRAFFFANLALSGAGAVLVTAVAAIARMNIFGGGFDADFSGWAWDMLSVYYRLSLIPFAVFFVLSVVSCKKNKKKNRQQNLNVINKANEFFPWY